MSPAATGQSFDKIHRLLFVASAQAQIFERPTDSSLHSAILMSKVPSRESIWNHRDCADQFFGRHPPTSQYKICPPDSGQHKRDKSPRMKEIGCGGWI